MRFRRVVFQICEWRDRQTNKQTKKTGHNAPHSYRGQVINVRAKGLNNVHKPVDDCVRLHHKFPDQCDRSGILGKLN